MKLYTRIPKMQHYYFLLSLLLFLCILVESRDNDTDSNLIVTLKSGKVKGLVFKSANNKEYYGFRGIPFGKSTAGSGRFRPPQPVDPWNGVFDATQFGPECPQFNMVTRGVEGTEDCLVVNVYTPMLPASSDTQKQLKPVLVFVHGGGFVTGTGSYTYYGPKRFMDYSVLLVTFNYRVGVLGFMSTEDEASPGNYGLMDQVLALTWIKENIEKFGGDKNKITLFGESAGSASVAYHLLSPQSTGLFQRAILQSGTSLNQWAIQRQPLQWTQNIAKSVDCPINDTWKLLSCFKERSVFDLVRKAYDLQISNLCPANVAPSIQNPSPNAFLTEDPLVLLKKGKIANKVPIIIGITELEYQTFYRDIMETYRNRGQKHWDEDLPKFFPFLFNMPSNEERIYKRIYEEYYGDQDVNDKNTFDSIQKRILSDAGFAVGIEQTAKLYSEAGIPTWTYMYAHVGKYGLCQLFGDHPDKYAGHGDELFVQFDFTFAQSLELNEEDSKVAHYINSLWTNFAKGENLSITTSDGNQIYWPPFNSKKPNYLRLNTNPEIVNKELLDKYEFWTETLPSLVEENIKKTEL